MRKKEKRKCTNCGITYERRTGVKFCSNKCQADYRQKKYAEEVERKGEFYNCVGKRASGGVTRTAKKYLIKKYGNKCFICLNEEWMGKPIPLVLDHIDGNSDNWKTSNIRLVCPNCDHQLDTFAGRNKNKGSSIRKELRNNYNKMKK